MRDFVQNFILYIENPANQRRATASVLLFALVARIAFAAVFPDQTTLLPDANTYRAAASEISSGRLISSPLIMPGYPLLIALFGQGAGQLAADIVASVLSVWCVLRIVHFITGDALCGFVGALVWAAYPFSLFYTVVGLTETLFVTLVLMAFLALYRSTYFLGGVALVAAILTRPSIEILAPLLLIAFALIVHRLSWLDTLRRLAIFAAVYLAMMAPWWLHNYAKYDQFVRLNLGGGKVMFAGNNPMNRSGGGTNTEVPPYAFSEIKDPVARDKAQFTAGLNYIAENPGHFFYMSLRKFVRLWRPWPYSDEYATPLFIIVSATTMLPLMLLSAIGAWAGLRGADWRSYVPILLFIGFNTAVHMITIGSVRYRFPMEPFLVILAAPVIADAIQRLAGAGKRRSLAPSPKKLKGDA